MRLASSFLKEGGFPKPTLTKDERTRMDLLKQYYEDIILKDVVARYKIREIDKLKQLGSFYANNFSSLISFNKTKKYLPVDISLDSIERFSDYLVNAYIFYFVPMFSYSIASQIKNNKKVYMIDNGMRSAIAFQFSEDRGKYLENAVFLELKKQGKTIYYFAKDQETDFLIMENTKVKEALNVCFSLQNKETRERELRSLTKAMDKFDLSQGTIITERDEEEIVLDKKRIKVIPFWRFALQV